MENFDPPKKIYGKYPNQNTGPTWAIDFSPLPVSNAFDPKIHRFERPLLLSLHFRIVPKGIVWPQPQPSFPKRQPWPQPQPIPLQISQKLLFKKQNSPGPGLAQDAFGGVDVARILKDKQRAGPRLKGVVDPICWRREKCHATGTSKTQFYCLYWCRKKKIASAILTPIWGNPAKIISCRWVIYTRHDHVIYLSRFSVPDHSSDVKINICLHMYCIYIYIYTYTYIDYIPRAYRLLGTLPAFTIYLVTHGIDSSNGDRKWKAVSFREGTGRDHSFSSWELFLRLTCQNCYANNQPTLCS